MLLMFLVVLPFWTSFLVRTFAMIFMMRDSGLINSLLLRLGQPDLLGIPLLAAAGVTSSRSAASVPRRS